MPISLNASANFLVNKKIKSKKTNILSIILHKLFYILKIVE